MSLFNRFAVLDPRRSLRARFAMIIGGSGLVFAIAVVLLLEHHEREQLESHVSESVQREAQALSNTLSLAMKERLLQIRQVASLPELASGLMEPAYVRSTLENARRHHPELMWMALLDRQGQVQTATGTLLEGQNLSPLALFTEGRRGPWIGEPHRASLLAPHLPPDAEGKPRQMLGLAMPVLDFEGQTIGVMAAMLDWRWISDLHTGLMQGLAHRSGMDSLVLTRSGMVVIGPAGEVGQSPGTPGLRDVMASGRPAMLRWPDGRRYLTATARVRFTRESGEADWTLIVRQDEDHAQGAARRLREQLVVGGLFASVIFALLSWWLADHVSRPIRRLSDLATRLRLGEKVSFSAAASGRGDELDDLGAALFAMETDVRQQIAQQRQSAARYMALFEASPDAIYVRIDRHLVFANRACLLLFGATDQSQLVGKTAFELFHPDQHADIAANHLRLDNNESVDRVHRKIVRLDGGLVDVEAMASPFDDNGQHAIHVVLRDISERERIAAELARHRDHLEELVEERTRALQQANVARSSSEEFARIVSDNQPTLVAYWDRDHRLRFANRAFLNWFGTTRELALGQDVGEWLGQDWQERLSRHDLEMTGASGQPGYFWADCLPHEQDGELCGHYLFATDVTQIKRAELHMQELNKELVLARDKAEAANQAKSTFLAKMSHEIRTPMNAIMGMAHLIKRDLSDPANTARLTILDDAARHLLDIINDILDLSKIEAGQLVLESINLDPAALLARACDLVAERAAAKDLTMVVDNQVPAGLLRGDPTRLSQTLLNLLSNAVKFTERGTVTLHAHVQAHDAEGVLVRFEVRDTGIGIAPDLIEGLFTPFVQADNSTTRRYGGTGLGLSITRHLAQVMGGEAGVSSELGQGSVFWFTARLLHPVAEARPARTPGTSAGELLREQFEGSRVLVAEDNLVNQQLVRELLEMVGLQVDLVGNGVQAVAWATRGEHDLILMDVHMPEMDGLQASRAIRELPQGQGVPIVAMTASAFPEEREACLEAGMDDHITKPIDTEAMLQTVWRWLSVVASTHAAVH